MTDCRYFEDLCSASLDAALTRTQKRELDAHLESCPACAAYLEDLKMLRAAWGDVKEPLPGVLHEKIMQGILEEAGKKAAPSKKTGPMPHVFTMIAAAAACVMLVMSGALGNLIGGLKVAAPADGAAADAGISDPVIHAFTAEGSTGEDEMAGGEDAPAPAYLAPQPEAGQGKAAVQPGEEQEGGKQGSAAADAGAAKPFIRSAAGDSRTKSANAAEELSVKLPDTLLANRFGFCYVAVGRGDVPVLEGASLIEKDGSTYYFRIENSMSGLEKLYAQLQDAGYETAMRTDIGIAADEDAADSLMIVSVVP